MSRNDWHGLAFTLAVGAFLAYCCAGCFPNTPPQTTAIPAVLAFD